MNVLFLGSVHRHVLLPLSRLSIAALLLLGVIQFAGGEPSSAAAGGTGYVSGKVYLDRDMDGEEDKDEPPLQGYKVNLRESLDPASTFRSAATDRDGRYRFDGLKLQVDYYLRLAPDDRILCPLDFSRGVRLKYQPYAEGADFGVVKKGNGRLSGIIFNDLNENGHKDAGEPPLAGWGIGASNLGLDRGSYCGVEVTAHADGSFAFTDLPPASFALFAWSPSHPEPVRGPYWQPWEVNFDRAADPPVAPDDIEYPRITLTKRRDSRRVDVGIHFPTGTGAITGRIFEDYDLDGIRDDGERREDAPEIWLWRQVDGRLLRWEHLGYAGNFDGDFLITGVPAGTYYLVASDHWREATTPTRPAGNYRWGYPYRWVTVSEGRLTEGVDFGYVSSGRATRPVPSATPTTAATEELHPPIVGSGMETEANIPPFVLILLAAGSMILGAGWRLFSVAGKARSSGGQG